MLTLRLTNCVENSAIPVLLQDIDCKLFELSKILYNNTIFSLNQPIQDVVFLDLLYYKRILTNRLCNTEYALYSSCEDCPTYTTDMIASRIKLLKFK
jgi:hypothetical protein